MSQNTNAAVSEKNRGTRRPKTRGNARSNKVAAEVSTLKDWLSTLNVGVVPTVHVNGHGFTMAILTVDFGTPLTPFRLNPEETSALHEHMRAVARAVINRDANFRVHHDGENGVYWVSL